MFHAKFPARRFDANGRHTGPGPWLDLIWSANEVEDGFFGSPESQGDWWAGGYVEEYPHARVIHNHDAPDANDRSVSVVAKTDHGHDVLTKAEQREKERTNA